MRYSNVDIRHALEAGTVVIDPPPSPECLGAVSIDLRLGSVFQVFTGPRGFIIDPFGKSPVDVSGLMKTVVLERDDSYLILESGEFILGSTLESVTLSPALVGRLDGRSSLARIGLTVHVTAHTIDPGFSGKITLEFHNCGPNPIALRPGMRICALGFECLETPTTMSYAKNPLAKYNNQSGPVASRIDRDEVHQNSPE